MKARKLIELTEYRKASHPPLTLEDVALQLDVSPAAVSRWEKGKRAPDRSNLIKIAGLIGKPAAQLAGLAE